MDLSLYNTLTGRVEPLTPQDPRNVKLYVCGLTVYNRGHIGNFRTLVAADLLRRTLRYKGYGVTEVLNVTDVDDRIIQQAQAAGKDLAAFTGTYVQAFEEDAATLRLERPEHVPRATEHVPDMIDLIARLATRGHTYAAEGSVYFRIASFPEYGALARLDLAGVTAGARVDADKYEKQDARDFVLWKAKSNEPAWAQWDAPFGRGRPGWHIECSAMSMKYLGETLDIHGGGVDLIFPHHDNEIAQSRCATGRPFARHWFHVEHLLVDDETMSKSKGNFYTVSDVLARGHRPDALRYLLAQAHYRRHLNFTWDGLGHAAAALERIHGFARRLQEVDREGPVAAEVESVASRARSTFDAALADDLNAPEALAAVHGLVGDGNALLAAGGVTRSGAQLLHSALAAMDSVFAVFLPQAEDRLSPEEQRLLDERQEARRRRDFARADAARLQLDALGVVLEDTAKGTRWRRKR